MSSPNLDLAALNPPKILTFDLETAPIKSYHWSLWDQNISLDQIQDDWSILAYAAKWLDNKQVIYNDTSGRGTKHVRNDKALCAELWALLNDADIVVAQNGKRFDVKKLNARLIINGFPPYSPIRVIDTMLVAKRHFGFTSNKLAYMSEHLTDSPKSKHKKFPGFELWSECLKDNPSAWSEMRKYNIQDVIATEKLYLKQRPWIDQHPNLSTYSGDVKPACPKCGSLNVIRGGTTVSQVGIYPRYRCKSCGSWSRGKGMLNPLSTRKTKLV